MQTFLTYADFEKTATVLDYRRLGKQRVEAFQIIRVLEGQSLGWKNHPSVKMWTGYGDALQAYFNAVSREWVQRGYKHTMGFYDIPGGYALPPWIGDDAFHLAHRSNLIRKLPDHYKQYWPDVPDDLPYVWPV